MANSASGDSLIERADRILASFSAATSRLTAAQIAQRAGLPSSTAHRLCAEMAQRGWLDREGNAYVVGTRLWELATRSAPDSSLAVLATPFMQDAQAALGQHIQLGRIEGNEVLILQRLSERGAREISSTVAGRLPLHVSAAGLVLLAWLPDDDRTAYLAALRDTGQAVPQGSVRTLAAVLSSVRATGHAVQTGNLEPDRTGIAVPVRGARATVVAALGAVIDRAAAAVDPAATVQVLRAAAHGIERTLKEHRVA
ncbi:IclR family transcriptional regulator [Kocuria coralli]|uniref:IclR family transcriptional regulator n=1 Tax=Kocuria coralli TaxID=1461025 RepID=A0A5J5KZU8_9MICC|nr:IclR family transcriptional regulator C-terminal domain-containing protein [Kocuria coralli]KAA9395219.1 IclR family transcriptional regulator [Kocuria coralli]